MSTAQGAHPCGGEARRALVRAGRTVLAGAVALFALTALGLPSALPAGAPPPEYTLVIEPDAGLSPVYSLIKSARHSLDMTMYELNDQRAETDLVLDARRGVKVRVLLDQNLARSYNAPAFQYLNSHGVEVRWAPTAYDVTHQKTITVDGNVSAVMTLNLTTQYYSSTRDYAVIDRDRADVAAVEAVFANDFAGRSRSPEPAGDGLIWSPGADTRLVRIIGSAKHALYVENEEMSEYTIVDALSAAARRGVNVDVVMTYSSSWRSNLDKLATAGVHVRTYAPAASLYIHAKVVAVDPGLPDAQLELGSQNFSWASLEYNRELGLDLGAAEAGIINSVAATVRSDFAGATPWSG
jgi:cardiolipin synthase A/B